MTAILRFLTALSLITVGLVSLARARPDWPEALCQAMGHSHTNEVEPPSAEFALATWRHKTKCRVTDKLLAGELTLFEAAAWFRRINTQGEGERYLGLLPGENLNEQTCSQVILWAEGQLVRGARRKEAGAWKTKLEEDLAQHRASYGKVTLPGWEGDE